MSAITNQQNAQHSTGPRTAEGKAAIRLNAISHGMHSQTVVLPFENNGAYEALGARLRDDLQPETNDERDLVQILQDTDWRIARLVALEANLHTLGTARHADQIEADFGPLDEASRIALAQASAFQANARTFEQLNRQEGRLRRLYSQTMEDLMGLFGLRASRLESAAANTAPKQNGFVPNNFSQPNTPPSDTPKFTGPLADHKRRQWLQKQSKAA